MNKKILINKNFFFSDIKKQINIIEKKDYIKKNTDDNLKIIFISSINNINNFDIPHKSLILKQIEKKILILILNL